MKSRYCSSERLAAIEKRQPFTHIYTTMANHALLYSNCVMAFSLAFGSVGAVAQTIESEPIDSDGWAKEQGFVEKFRKDLRSHLEGARNVSIPADANAFAWRIDWKKQQAYCFDIADALFKNTQRLSFPDPDFSATRDPSTKLTQVLQKLPVAEGVRWRLPVNSPESAAVDFEEAIATESTRQGKPTRMRKGPCDSLYWQRSYVGAIGNAVYQFTEMVNPAQAGCIGNEALRRPIAIEGSYRQLVGGDWFHSGIWGTYPNDTSPDDRTDSAKAILGAVDGSPVILEFGTYSFPPVKLGEMGVAKSDWGKPLYGKKGQRFVLVAHPQKSFENSRALGGFAIEGPLPESKSTRGLNGWPDPKYGNDSSRYACFINFDDALRK